MTAGNASYPVMKNGAPYICHNNGGQVVIGEFVCDYILHWCHMANADIAEAQSCVRREDISQYSNGKAVYGWHISDLVIYGDPKPLSKFMKPCENDLYCESCAMHSEFSGKCGNKALVISRPPQSWCYVEDVRANE